MMTLHCNLSWQEEAAAAKLFDGELTDAEEERFSAKFTQYVFFDPWGRRDFRECICTACGRFEAEKRRMPSFFKERHGDSIECPQCGTPATLYALNRMRTGAGLQEFQRAAFLRPGPDGSLLISAGYGRKDYNWNDLMPRGRYTEKVRTYLAPGKRGQWRRYVGTTGWYMMFGAGSWERSETVKEPFGSYMYQSDGSYWLFSPEALEATDLCYCQLDDWYYDECNVSLLEEQEPVKSVHRYLAAYTEFPQIEMAVKIGMADAATDLALNGRKNARALNWAAKCPWEFLRMSKADGRALMNSGIDLAGLNAFHAERKRGTVSNVREFLELVRVFGSYGVLDNAGKVSAQAGVSLKQAAKYMQKFQGEVSRNLSVWKDYLDMTQRLGYDLSDPTVLMPKNLHEQHDLAADAINLLKTQEEEKRYAARYRNLTKLYAFAYGGMEIVVPRSSAEIVQEGKTLRHCVGGYAARHINGKVDILFLRRSRKRGTPFITIEMYPRTAVRDKPVMKQIHGYRNENYIGGSHHNPEKQFGWFLDVWMEWMASGGLRDKKGKPILGRGLQNMA